MTTLCILSMFSNAEKYLPHYLGQCHLFEWENRYNLEVWYVWLTGNNQDNTHQLLWDHQGDKEVIAFDVPTVYGSIETSERFAQLAEMWGMMLDRVYDCDYAAIIESDLTWYPHTLYNLLRFVQHDECDIAAPSVIKASSGLFYDIWAYRYQGQRFRQTKPYYDGYDGSTPVDLDSAGSFLVTKGDVARTIRCTPEDELVGFCNNARKAGYRVRYYPDQIVWHP